MFVSGAYSESSKSGRSIAGGVAKESSKHQAPSTRETSSSKSQRRWTHCLVLGYWSFSGAWSLELGASAGFQFRHGFNLGGLREHVEGGDRDDGEALLQFGEVAG